MKRILVAFFVISTLLPLSAFADTRSHHAAHVTFWLPDSWTVEGDEGSQLTASDPKGEAALLFVLQGHKDMKSAIAAIDDTIAKLATDVKMGAPKLVDINGMEGSVVDATGKSDGKRIELSVLIVKTPGNKYLMIFGVLESAHKHAHDAELTKIVASLKPVR